MKPPRNASLDTRPSLLRRLTVGDDNPSWREFYDTYRGLILYFADKAGLTADEAEEVVQETAIGVARRLPNFVYDPKVCRFKTWLLNLVRWRIQDQLRKRHASGRVLSGQGALAFGSLTQAAGDAGSTATWERIPDPAVPEFGAEWDAAWEKNLLERALDTARAKLDERQFQIFDLYVVKGWPAAEVAQTLGISAARVYLAKHRVEVLVKKEVRRLEKCATA